MYLFNVWSIIIQSLNMKEWKLLELQITQTRHTLSISDGKKCLSSTALKICTKKRHMFNVWPIIMQSLNIKEWKLFELQNTQTRNHLSITMSKFKTPQKWKKKSWHVHKIGGEHFKCVNNHHAKLNIKEWILLELKITQTRHRLSILEGKKRLSSKPVKNEKNI